MKTYRYLPIISLTALVAFGPFAQAHQHRCHRHRGERTVRVVSEPTYVVVQRQDPWIVRAGRTVLRTPLIIGETITGRRHIGGPAPIAERIDRPYYRDRDVYMIRSDGRTLSGRCPGEDLELFQ